jgi:hypothetical protein
VGLIIAHDVAAAGAADVLTGAQQIVHIANRESIAGVALILCDFHLDLQVARPREVLQLLNDPLGDRRWRFPGASSSC